MYYYTTVLKLHTTVLLFCSAVIQYCIPAVQLTTAALQWRQLGVEKSFIATHSAVHEARLMRGQLVCLSAITLVTGPSVTVTRPVT